MVCIQVLESVDHLPVQPLGLQHLEHPGENHQVKGCHVVIVQYTCTLVLAVCHMDGIPSLADTMVYPPIISSR